MTERDNADNKEPARGTPQRPPWQYDEMKPSGVDYREVQLVREYDARHERFRDYRRQSEEIMDRLDLGPSATVIDMGCGTGAFALHAARRYRRIHAVDVSEAMLSVAREKADAAGLTNVAFHHGGFLTYEHQVEPADAAVSTVALHHLPDFWKLVGLYRLAQMLKPGGRFYLFDVVFSFPVERHEATIEQFIDAMTEQMGPTGRAEPQTHIRDEYSTCHWIMEGLLERAGFQIDEVNYNNEFLAGYLCTRKVHSAGAEPLTGDTQPLR